MFTRLLILFIFMLIFDIINHFGLKAMLKRHKDFYAYKYNLIAYWSVGLLMIIVLFVSLAITGYPQLDYEKYRIYFFLFGFWLIFYLPRMLFSTFVILQTIYYILLYPFNRRVSYAVKREKGRRFTLLKTGLIISFSSSLLVIYGMVWGKSDFKVETIELYMEGLPESFNGFKIAQFSDAHLGSFTNQDDVKKGLELLQAQNPDMIVFTGDMVNNIADEMEPYFAELTKIKAPYGKFSILGNHDMSDYVKWKNFELQQAFIQKLVYYQENCGFDVLLNESRIIRKGNDSIALIGVKNWGLPPFKQYGDLEKAISNVNNMEIKILLSHDPTHWKEQVKNKTTIKLTLSGHTHGAQLGINYKGFKWSPVQYIYENWLGLYTVGNQYLYVNPGFGYLAFPGRVGIQPEITLFILKPKI